MAKSVKSLTGEAKDAYVRRLLAEVPGLSIEAAQQLGKRLAQDVTRLWVKATSLPHQDDGEAGRGSGQASRSQAAPAEHATLAVSTAHGAGSFDPYSPNVVVVLRKTGRDGAMAALGAIREADHLRLLAREQQLGIEPELSGLDEIRLAIIAAAERRIANRRAAGS